ncbi:MAG: SET domain-containing protein [Cyclobacteriaceae bacterium]
MAYLEKLLVVKKSRLPGAGLGLFTKAKIPKGSRIVEYKGRLQSWSEVKHEDGYNGYILRVNQRLAINAQPYKKALGRFANDANGLSRSTLLKNNAEYIVDGHKCFIDAIVDIPAGKEIFVGYGWEYWSLIRRLITKKSSSN